MRRQDGFTLGSVLLLLLVAGWCAYTAFRIVPAYIDYFLVKNSLDAVANDLTAAQMSEATARMRVAKEFNINNISAVSYQEVEFERVSNGIRLTADFSTKVPYIGPISLAMDFHAVAETR
jgi:hypothetical protein